MSGIFISFEGLEGSGKSTQVGLLASRLKELGKDILVTREPGGTRIGEQIRDITHNRDNVDLTAVAEAYLMAASRAQHVRELIRPALEAGKIVLADRFIDSSLAYQGYGREIGEEVIFDLNKLAFDGVFPILTVFLDVTPEVGLARREHSEKLDRLDLQQKDFYKRVYEGYRDLAQKHSGRYRIIDGNAEMNKIAQDVWAITEEFVK
jgi:dTMP kinase